MVNAVMTANDAVNAPLRGPVNRPFPVLGGNLHNVVLLERNPCVSAQDGSISTNSEKSCYVFRTGFRVPLCGLLWLAAGPFRLKMVFTYLLSDIMTFFRCLAYGS